MMIMITIIMIVEDRKEAGLASLWLPDGVGTNDCCVFTFTCLTLASGRARDERFSLLFCLTCFLIICMCFTKVPQIPQFAFFPGPRIPCETRELAKMLRTLTSTLK